jgi:hypothetical protein
MSVAPPSGQNRVMIYGPKNDGTYIVEFRTADGEAPSVNPTCLRNNAGGGLKSRLHHLQKWISSIWSVAGYL